MKNKTVFLTLIILTILVLTGCTNSGLSGIFDNALPKNVNDFGDFLGAVICVLVATFILTILLTFIIGDLAGIAATLIIFIYLFACRDYGFFLTTLVIICTYISGSFINKMLINHQQ